MTDHDRTIDLQKAVLWEQAKGLLRAMVAADGQRSTGGAHREEPLRFQVVGAAVEAFITDFEGEGLHE